MQITTSPDITTLQVSVVFDISGLLPVINLTNLSAGPHLNNVSYWFLVTSPSGTIIHQGTQATPDVTGVWSTFSLTDAWPMPFSSIEFSGAPYNLTVYAQDSASTIYTDPSYSATICRPNGNTQSSRNPYGVATTIVTVQCQQARIYFEDTTMTSYKGLTGTLLNSLLRVIYPIDPTYNIPPPFVATFTSPILVPLTYSSSNYQFIASSIYNYQLSTFVSVNIKYQTVDPKTQSAARSFSVFCNIDLMPLVCEYQKLLDSIENGTCLDVQTANNNLLLINPKFALVCMGIMQPLTGIDVPELIEQIQKIGGFSCNCCSAPSGIIPQTSSVIDGYSFSIVPVCGDISGTVTTVGTNIQFNLQDLSYNFIIGPSTNTTAVSITPATSGCVKTYSLVVDATQLATDILNIISTNSGLTNLFNSINTSSGASLVVDGKCIFQSSATFGYTFTLVNIPSSATFALITSIQNGSTNVALSFSLNLTNLAAFQTYLNGLGLGNFTVTNPTGQTVLVSSSANPNALSTLIYNISSTNFIADFTSTASGYSAIPANQVVQNIINYLCGLTDAQIDTSVPYTITYIDAAGKTQTFVEPVGTSLSQFIQDLLKYEATTITSITSTGVIGVSCSSIQKVFVANSLQITGTDVIYGTKGNGQCSPVNFLDAFNYMLTAGQSNATIKNLFCEFVTSCGAGLTCDPYTFFNVLVSDYNTLCTPISGIVFTLS